MKLHEENREKFWDKVATEYYGKQGFYSDNLHCEKSIDQASLFKSVVECCDQYEDGKWGVRLYLNDEEVLDGRSTDRVASVRHLFPTLEDVDFAGYNQRMESLGHEYCLVINDIERKDFPLWDWSRRFLSPLFHRRGMNHMGIFYCVFVGNYKKTIFGAHFDPECVFQIPIIASKKMRLWEAEYVEANHELRESMEYDAHLDASCTIESGPGGFNCWPKKNWHIAESEGHFHVSLALAMQEYSDITPYLVNNVICKQLNDQRELIDHFEYEGLPDEKLEQKPLAINTSDLASSAAQIPDSFLASFKSINEKLSDKNKHAFWMRLATAFGFTTSTEPLPTQQLPEVSANTCLSADCQFPIVAKHFDENTLLVAANGHVYELSPAPWYTAVIEQLNSGEAPTQQRLKALVPAEDGNLFEQFIQTLLSIRAIHVN